MSSGVTASVEAAVRAAAGHRCGYCRAQQEHVYGFLEIEHIVPKAAGGTDEEENLWLACRFCNSFKGAQTHALDPVTGRRTRLFNPRQQSWKRHFLWSGPYVVGIMRGGRATVLALNMNNTLAVMVRRRWMEAGWHPPQE